MYKNKRLLAIIPARGGSKGIPHKNIIDLCGKQLISYTIEAGLKSKYLDFVMVSTDDKDIANISQQYGAEIPFMRPAELASDTSKTLDAILYTINTMEAMGEKYDALVLLQPTQPLRTSEDIDQAIEKYAEHGYKDLVSISEVDDHPILMRTIEDEKLIPLLDTSSTCRRQDMPKYYKVNGCIYINTIKQMDENTSFNDNEIPFLMEKSHSVDIDELSDLALAAYYISHQ